MAEAEREVLERRRQHLIIRVDRADLSKNVLRGFTAFDTFLTQHPEFREKVTFIAHLQPSRQDVPEYAEYLERIEALVAVVNHRHGTTDWMPIDLKIYENFYDAVARYKHFDLLMVNSLFDGMNLVAKEAPAVNTRDGVLMLSENTGSHQELFDYVISVNPFDIQEQADAIHRALTMDPEQKRQWAEGLREIIFSRNPGDWVDDQLKDIEAARSAQPPEGQGGEFGLASALSGGAGGASQVGAGSRRARRWPPPSCSRCRRCPACCARRPRRRWKRTWACRGTSQSQSHCTRERLGRRVAVSAETQSNNSKQKPALRHQRKGIAPPRLLLSRRPSRPRRRNRRRTNRRPRCLLHRRLRLLPPATAPRSSRPAERLAVRSQSYPPL